ncbi:MAG: hypothetical protein A3I05_06775 [Deltaproteobacteria bacterium RIFCSPLOWO2_02_FULL_44_10]|nr:MAG: hypothetical protein A3C46_06965 [Deltaproteobacteria bacterium RIFCSPHIGHO2_02_FULL_44_16]OGQ46729.1 MAG: hypothetical protein A3I05_06775 [Deltaproteobacteria bacterium RIFCSPLOWO2_02_FULL_44_10]
MKKPLLIFDFDGVIADSLNLYQQLVYDRLIALEYNFLQSPEDLQALFETNVIYGFQKRGVHQHHINEILLELDKASETNHISLFEGIPEFFQNIELKTTNSIVSSNTTLTINRILTSHSLTSHFTDILGGDGATNKVDRIHFLLEKSSLEKNRTFYIGDTIGDMKEAKLAGITAIGVTWGLHSEQKLRDARADYILHSPKHLADFIHTL